MIYLLLMLKPYCAKFSFIFTTSKKPYAEIVTSTNQFTEEAEASLKELISESKEMFAKTKYFFIMVLFCH
jgi:hypothetical protein